jgi:hypothetical protein
VNAYKNMTRFFKAEKTDLIIGESLNMEFSTISGCLRVKNENAGYACFSSLDHFQKNVILPQPLGHQISASPLK